MTREQLSEGICTTKYLYLIEKGERTPSNAILLKLGERMNTSLFNYYGFLECDDPIEVKRIMDGFDFCRWHFDCEWLMKYQNIADTKPDFKRIPWKFEIDFNKSMLKLIVDGKPAETAIDILETISEMPSEYQYGVCHLRQLVLLSLCYLESGKKKSADFTIELVWAAIENKLDCLEFQQLCFASAHVYMIIKIKTGDLTAAAVMAEVVLQQQKNKNCYDFYHFSLLLKGYTMIELGKSEEARESIRRGLLLLLVFDKSRDLAYLNHIGILKDILQSGLLDETLLEEIKKKYRM